MHRIGLVGLLVLVAACNEASRGTADGTPPRPVPASSAGDAAQSTAAGDPNRWVEAHFAPGWFPVQPVEGYLGEEVNLDPTGEAFDRAEAPATPDVCEGLGAVPLEEMERENHPRFGLADDDIRPADATPVPWQRSGQSMNAARLMVGDEDALPLEAFQASVRIDGHRARVVLDFCYRNTFDFEAEGVFKLRLPDDAAVHYLAFGEVASEAPLLLAAPTGRALDLAPAALTAARNGGGAYGEGRIVPRETAQQAYAAETARAVDPALLEWNGAGIFTTRVFPLLPGRTSRITIAYDVDVALQGGARFLDLGIPPGAAAVRVTIQDDGAAAGVRTVDEVAGPVMRIALPAHGVTAIVGTDPAIGPHFAASIAPQVPAMESTPARRAIFLVDASMSANPERMNVWIELLRATLEQNRDDLSEFAVLFFNVETWWWREKLAPHEPETVERLLRDVARIALEGATDVGAALAEADAPSWSSAPLDADLFLLSDGAETWGVAAALDVAARLRAPVYCYATGLPGTDTRALSAIARATGGAVFTVTGASDVAAAAVAHRSLPWMLREIRVAGCEDVLIAGRPSALFAGQRLRIAGRGRPAPGDEVVLTLEQSGVTRDVRVAFDRVRPSPLASRAYGEIAVGQLESLGAPAARETRAYALHYGVTGETCSLLMLESEERYLAYGIVRTANAETVRARPVTDLVAGLAAVAARTRADAREAFLVWLDRLERLAQDGGGFRDLDELRAAARELPASAFDVKPAPLACATRTWDDVSGGFERLMRSADPGYGAVWAEAEGRRSVRGAPDALRALSSLVEADPGSTDLARDVAFTALDWDLPGAAYGLLLRVAAARPFEPETYRALAESLERTGNTDYAMLMHEIALRGNWDRRFGAFPLIAAMDYRGLLRRIERGAAATRLGALADAARERIAAEYVNGDADIVVTMTWNTDRTDVDLHVTDPADETCFYGHPRTKLGGAITADVTQGYGPEMFVLGRAVPGAYVVKARYYGSDALRKTLRSRVFVTVTRRFGAPDEQRERRAFLLEDADDAFEALRFTWPQ